MRWLVMLCTGCLIARQPFPFADQATVALVTGTLTHPMEGIARHPWFAVYRPGDRLWTVYEVGGGGEELDPFRHHDPYKHPVLVKVWRGADAERAAACLEAEAPAIKRDIEDHYIFYPGPNSNTFGDRVLRKCGLHASLPATSVGKDWRGWIGGGVTSEGTGLQLETPFVGVKIGLKEGIEVHVIGLSFGVDFWPPAIILPLGPGRLGFADR